MQRSLLWHLLDRAIQRFRRFRLNASQSSLCWIARFSAFGDFASTHRNLAFVGSRDSAPSAISPQRIAL